MYVYIIEERSAHVYFMIFRSRSLARTPGDNGVMYYVRRRRGLIATIPAIYYIGIYLLRRFYFPERQKYINILTHFAYIYFPTLQNDAMSNQGKYYCVFFL